MPVLGTMPAMFGMAAASHILCHLAEQPFNPEPLMEIIEQQYDTQMARLMEREETKFGNADSVAVDYSDVRFLARVAVCKVVLAASVQGCSLTLSQKAD